MYKTIADIKKALSSGETASSILEEHIHLAKEKTTRGRLGENGTAQGPRGWCSMDGEGVGHQSDIVRDGIQRPTGRHRSTE